jgi:hypothetical protein
MRTSVLVSIPPLLGVDFTGSVSQAEKDAVIYLKFLEMLNGAISGQEPKLSRLAGWVFGKLVNGYYAASVQDISGGEATVGVKASSQVRTKDPADYRRLNHSSSFLRAAFDSLTKLPETPSTVIIRSLAAVEQTLPPVNWAVSITKLTEAAKSSGNAELLIECFEFTSKHASSSSAKSLVDLFISQLLDLISDVSHHALAVSPKGVGKLLDLGGLPRKGTVGVESKESTVMGVAVAPSKVMEILSKACMVVFSEGAEIGTKTQVCAFFTFISFHVKTNTLNFFSSYLLKRYHLISYPMNQHRNHFPL